MPLAALGNLFGADFLLIGLVGLVAAAFWVWMLLDCIANRRLSDTDRIIWVLVILVTQIIGALLYYFLARGGRAARPGA